MSSSSNDRRSLANRNRLAKEKECPAAPQSYLTMEEMQGFGDVEVLGSKINICAELTVDVRVLTLVMFDKISRSVDQEALNVEQEIQRTVIEIINTNLLGSALQNILRAFRASPNDITSIITAVLGCVNVETNLLNTNQLRTVMITTVASIQHYAQAKPKNFMYS